MEKLISARQAATILGVSSTTFLRNFRQGNFYDFQPVRVSRSRWKWRESDVNDFLEKSLGMERVVTLPAGEAITRMGVEHGN